MHYADVSLAVLKLMGPGEYVLLRAGDPLYELSMPVMHRMEDRFWTQTMIALARRLGVADPAVQTRALVLDPKRQWRRAGNVWQNAMARSVLQTVVPVRRQRRG